MDALMPKRSEETDIREDLFLGVRLAHLTVDDAAAYVAHRPPNAPFGYIVTPNAQHFVVLNRGSAGFRAAYDGALLRLCDSKVVPHLARLLFGIDLVCCPGSDLTAALFRKWIQPDDSITVIGGDDELAARLRQNFGLTRLALHQPPMGFINDPREVQACLDFVAAHPARYIFIAVGAPRGEILALKLKERGDITGTCLSIGGSLHFITGLVPRAPRWMRDLALEWLYRLLLNPRRHARRVFLESFPVLGLALAARFQPPGIRHHLPPIIPS